MEANQHNKSWNEQCFGVQAFINFSVMNEAHLDGAHLCELIKEVDKANPWVSYWEGGSLAPSINWMSEAKMQDAAPWIDRNYTVEIRPTYHLKADKFYAYNRYISILAEKLAAMGLEGVHTVSARLEIQGGGASYCSPAALARLEETMKQPAAQELKALLQRAIG